MITYGKHSTYGVDTDGHPVVEIGNYTRIATGTTFYGNINYPSTNNPKLVCNYAFAQHEGFNFPDQDGKGKTIVGNDVFIGYGCSILSGVTIGNGAIIGMKTIVSKDVPAYSVVVGSPMVIKKYRFLQTQINALERIAWWNWSEELIKERLNDFLDVDIFIQKYG